MKKEKSAPDLAKLEMKINLLNDKVDRLMEFLKVELVQPPDAIKQEEEKKRKARDRQQAKILQKENFRKDLERRIEDRHLLYSPYARQIREQFNLVVMPSANRIREYQRSNDPSAFDGLARRPKNK